MTINIDECAVSVWFSANQWKAELYGANNSVIVTVHAPTLPRALRIIAKEIDDLGKEV